MGNFVFVPQRLRQVAKKIAITILLTKSDVFQVNVLPTPGNVPLVSQVNNSPAAFVLGPIFYILLSILLLLSIVCIIWGIRAARTSKRKKMLEAQKFETQYLAKMK